MKVVRCCAVFAALAACDEHQYDNTPLPPHSRAVEGMQPPSPAPMVATQQERTFAAQAMTVARCDREQRCKNIGEGRVFKTRAACMSAIGETWREELNNYECPGTIVQNALDRCMDEIRNQECLNPFTSLERLIDCDPNQVCDTPDPGR